MSDLWFGRAPGFPAARPSVLWARLLRITTAVTTSLASLAMVAAASAQTFTGTYVTSGPFSGGTQYFHHRSRIDASAANAVSGGTQWFYNTSRLDASAANAVSGGYQYFDGNSSLNASAANAVTGWGQDFWGSSSLNATAANAISGSTQKFYETSTLNASVANAVSGGYQWFYDTSKLNASATNAVSGGALRFYDTSTLNILAANAVSGGGLLLFDSSIVNAYAANSITSGDLWLSANTTLNASAANAVSGGSMEFRDSSSLNASVTNAVSGGTFRFYGTSTLNISAANAVSGGSIMLLGSNIVNASVANAINNISPSVLWLSGNSTVNALVPYAVNGGTLALRGSSTLNASATNAVSAVIEHWGDGTVQVLATNALTNGAAINLYNSSALVLNGFSTTVGQIGQTGSIRNTGAADSILTVDSSVRGDSVYAGRIEDGGAGKVSLVKTGAGTLTLGGYSPYTGSTTVNGGRLIVNGLIRDSAVTVGSGGTLGGIGYVGVTTVAAGGTVAPGNSIGTLKVVGNFTFAPGAAYEVEVNPANTSSDRIDVTGTAFLNGGTVVHTGLDGAYGLTSTYTILTATSGIIGGFDGVSEDLAFLDATLAHGPNNVTLTLTRNGVSFAVVGQTGNQDAGAASAASLGAGNVVHDTILGLDAAEARAAFDALSGEIHASAKTALIEDSRFVRTSALDRVRAAFDGTGSVPAMDYGRGVTGWGHVFGSWGESDGNGNAAELKRETGGLLVGADGLILDTWRLGVLAGYSRANFDMSHRASSGESDNAHLGLYGGTQWGPLGLRAGAAHSWHGIETNRWVNFPGFSEQLTDDYTSRTAQVFGELGYRIDGPVAFEPFAGLAYVNLHTGGYNEDGGAAALSGSRSDTGVTFTTLGLRASTTFMFGDLNATARGMLGWRHAFGDTAPLAAHSGSGGDLFIVAGAPIADDTAIIETGLDLGIAADASLGLSYSGQFAPDAQDHGVRANLSIRF